MDFSIILIVVCIVAVVVGLLFASASQAGGADVTTQLDELMFAIESNPSDTELHDRFLRVVALAQFRGTNAYVQSHSFYMRVLALIEEVPQSTAVRIFALEVGRWHYSKNREDGNPTVYDEQAIQNDIAVRTLNEVSEVPRTVKAQTSSRTANKPASAEAEVTPAPVPKSKENAHSEPICPDCQIPSQGDIKLGQVIYDCPKCGKRLKTLH